MRHGVKTSKLQRNASHRRALLANQACSLILNGRITTTLAKAKALRPYVEKLMPTIKFLRDTLNFGDAIIRKLCTFKDVSIKGELYSREFNQHFRADKTICSLKEDKEGNFNLNIDGVSHVSWFRRKKDEFMETLGLPTRKQDKGIRL